MELGGAGVFRPEVTAPSGHTPPGAGVGARIRTAGDAALRSERYPGAVHHGPGHAPAEPDHLSSAFLAYSADFSGMLIVPYADGHALVDAALVPRTGQSQGLAQIAYRLVTVPGPQKNGTQLEIDQLQSFRVHALEAVRHQLFQALVGFLEPSQPGQCLGIIAFQQRVQRERTSTSPPGRRGCCPPIRPCPSTSWRGAMFQPACPPRCQYASACPQKPAPGRTASEPRAASPWAQ